MLYDLNIDGHAGNLALRGLLAEAVVLGYDVVALERRGHKLGEQLRASLTALSPEAIQAADPRAASALRDRHRLLCPTPDQAVPRACELQQVYRLTFTASEPAITATLFTEKNPIAKTYDILAVQPQSERVFTQACKTLTVDLITLDLSKRLPFTLKRAPILAAVKRGVSFELTYSTLLDEYSRAKYLEQATTLCGITHGHGIIATSGASSIEQLRAPSEVIAMMQLCGLSEAKAQAAVSTRPRQLLATARLRRVQQGAVQYIEAAR